MLRFRKYKFKLSLKHQRGNIKCNSEEIYLIKNIFLNINAASIQSRAIY
jgi:hypothetical protein